MSDLRARLRFNDASRLSATQHNKSSNHTTIYSVKFKRKLCCIIYEFLYQCQVVVPGDDGGNIPGCDDGSCDNSGALHTLKKKILSQIP